MTTSPTCGHCAAPLIRRPGESAWKFRRREFCNVAHSARARIQAFPVRNCRECGGVLVRREGEDAHKFLARTFCGPVCRNQGQVAKFPPKHCKGCAALLIRRAGENANKFAARIFCNMTCRGRWQTSDAERRLGSGTKVCPCGAVFHRNLHRSMADFAARKYCSLGCSSRRETIVERHAQKRYSKPTPAQPYSYGRQYQYIKPPAPGTPFEDPAQWLATHAVTKCPDRYCAPVIGAMPIPSTEESAA